MSGAILETADDLVTLEQLDPCETPALRVLPNGEIGMLNRDWIELYEACRLADGEKLGRIELWEEWERNERIAQKEVKP